MRVAFRPAEQMTGRRLVGMLVKRAGRVDSLCDRLGCLVRVD